MTFQPDGPGLTITYEIDFPHPIVGRQELTFTLRPEEFASRIAPARTFGFARDVEAMRARGLARGGSLQNAVVLDDTGIVSGPLRFRDEFVRHKVLDLIGDLALLGRPLHGHIHARKAGHALHIEFARALHAAMRAPPSEPRTTNRGLAADRELRARTLTCLPPPAITPPAASSPAPAPPKTPPAAGSARPPRRAPRRASSPTISDPTIGTPWRSASERTHSKTRCRGVFLKFVMLIETWTIPRSASSTPIAFT